MDYGLSVVKPKNNGLLKEEKHQRGSNVEQKGTRLTYDGEDWKGLELTILISLANFFKNTQTVK